MICEKCGLENEGGAKFCAGCGEPLAGGGEHLGPYELRGELGRGAMARVWRAWDPNLEREVAIKEPLFDPRLGDDVLAEMGRRFVKEGKAAARLQYAGIVTIYAADVYDGRPAIVMELVDGATLGEILEREGKLAPEAALDALDQLLDAVGYAHGRGVVHRDIKPDNIFVGTDGKVKLADFGIARVDDPSATRATVVGTVLGTPGYMSPEQATGAAVDARSDLFSIGVVGYEMLAGANPFGAGDGTDSTTLLYRIVHEPAPELPASAASGLPSDLRPAIMAALAKSPDDRPQSAEAFKSMLHGRAAVPAASGAAAARLAGADSGLAGAASKVHGGKLPKWAPYAIVGGICIVVLLFVLFGAMSSGGGGSAGGGSNLTMSSSASSNAPVYLAVKDGKVAIYTNSSAEPYEVSDVEVADLSDDDQAEIDNRPGFSTVEEAQAAVGQYEEAAEKAKKEAEEKAAREKEEAAAKANANTVSISIVGADGTTRTADIRRQGTSERVIPDSNSRRISESEAAALSDAERCIAWNEIIAASNGYAFKNSGLASYFAGCSWYHRDASASGNGNLSSDASANVDLLKRTLSDNWWLTLATN